MDPLTRLLNRYQANVDQPLGSVTRVVEFGYKGMPIEASVHSEARIIICLRGTAHYAAQHGHVRLRAGDGLFIAPGKWIQATPQRHYLTLGVVFESAAPRCYLSLPERQPDRRWTTCLPEQLRWPCALPEEGHTLCRLLERKGGNDRYYHGLFESLLAHCRHTLAQPPDNLPSKALITWQAAEGYLADHLHLAVGREEVAAYLHIHPNHLSRLCLRFAKISFARYMQDKRLERARILLADPSLNVGEVATRTGFGSANYFIRLYRQRYGTTPATSRPMPES
ncbi:MAG: helix-turn-helix transcriptional regulator [Verrucomicrobiota bacterium JB024]|nr:helix-turn-helix transcriptional regulator [Verrucomicrobiota bacterium JB024]